MANIGNMTQQIDVMDSCPGCGQGITGRVTVDVEVDDDRPAVPGHLSLVGKITGLSVSHDCIPKVTRGRDAALRGLCNDGACMDDTPHPAH